MTAYVLYAVGVAALLCALCCAIEARRFGGTYTYAWFCACLAAVALALALLTWQEIIGGLGLLVLALLGIFAIAGTAGRTEVTSELRFRRDRHLIRRDERRTRP